MQKRLVHTNSVIENCSIGMLLFQEKCKLLLRICIYLFICAFNCLLNRKQQTCPFQEHKLLAMGLGNI